MELMCSKIYSLKVHSVRNRKLTELIISLQEWTIE